MGYLFGAMKRGGVEEVVRSVRAFERSRLVMPSMCEGAGAQATVRSVLRFGNRMCSSSGKGTLIAGQLLYHCTPE